MKTNIEMPKLTEIKGTDLAYILTRCGRDENGFDGRIRTIRESNLGWDNPNKESIDDKRILNNYCIKIYIKDGRSLEELSEAISSRNNDGHLPRPHMVGDMYFSAVNQNLTLDANGNLLLKSHGSQLENLKIEGGDVLIDAKGHILRDTRGSMYIHALEQPNTPDECVQFGYYKTTVFKSKSNPDNNTTDIVGIEYNFLSPKGKQVSRTHFDKTDRPTIVPVERTYRDDRDGLFISKEVLPTGYVYTDKDNIFFFPSAVAFLIANRTRKSEHPNLPSLIEDETPIIQDFYARQEDLPRILEKLSDKCYKGFRGEKGGVSYETYYNIRKAMKEESDLNVIFTKTFETESDRAIHEEMCSSAER